MLDWKLKNSRYALCIIQSFIPSLSGAIAVQYKIVATQWADSRSEYFQLPTSNHYSLYLICQLCSSSEIGTDRRIEIRHPRPKIFQNLRFKALEIFLFGWQARNLPDGRYSSWLYTPRLHPLSCNYNAHKGILFHNDELFWKKESRNVNGVGDADTATHRPANNHRQASWKHRQSRKKVILDSLLFFRFSLFEKARFPLFQDRSSPASPTFGWQRPKPAI